MLEDKGVNFVCGPDAYRDIPSLINTVTSTDQKAANTQLSLDETYADYFFSVNVDDGQPLQAPWRITHTDFLLES